MRSRNPALQLDRFEKERSFNDGQSMTVQGAVNKTFMLLFLLCLSASWIWGKIFSAASMARGYAAVAAGSGIDFTPYLYGGLIGGLVLAIVTIFKKPWSPFTTPLYAVCEGLVLGSISAMLEMSYPGIVVQAVMLTFGTLFCMLIAYKSGLIRATEKFRSGIMAATGAICLIYFVSWILSFFDIVMPVIHSGGIIGIGFSLLVVTIAALNLILDFDLIERAADMGVPKYMEWYCAFGLLVTLVWLYMEILRLLAKFRSRD